MCHNTQIHPDKFDKLNHTDKFKIKFYGQGYATSSLWCFSLARLKINKYNNKGITSLIII